MYDRCTEAKGRTGEREGGKEKGEGGKEGRKKGGREGGRLCRIKAVVHLCATKNVHLLSWSMLLAIDAQRAGTHLFPHSR